MQELYAAASRAAEGGGKRGSVQLEPGALNQIRMSELPFEVPEEDAGLLRRMSTAVGAWKTRRFWRPLKTWEKR